MFKLGNSIEKAQMLPSSLARKSNSGPANFASKYPVQLCFPSYLVRPYKQTRWSAPPYNLWLFKKLNSVLATRFKFKAAFMAELWTGAPNDGFVLNTLKTLFRLSSVAFRCLEMNSKPRYKICVCSVIPGERESFRDYQVFSIIFPNILDAM